MCRNTLAVHSGGINNIQFFIEYVGPAVINGQKYQLGIINFDVVMSTDKVNVTLNEANDIIFSVPSITSNKVVIQADKNGVTETLELRGERVNTVGLNSINIFVNSV